MDEEVPLISPRRGKAFIARERMKRMQLPFGECADWWSGISPLQFGDVALFPGDEEMRHTRTCDLLSAVG